MRARHVIAATAAVASGVLLTAACSSSSSSSSSSTSTSSTSSSSTTNWATATSAAACGGMSALVAAAKKEGQLNVITLPSNWANYGTIMKDFTAKYGIKITDANPEGSSQDEINAVKQLKGQSRAPDVVDVGTSFAVKGDQAGHPGPVQGRDLEQHPGRRQGRQRRLLRRLRRLRGHRLRPGQGQGRADLVREPAQPDLQEQVAINGNPTQAGAAFAAVYAAALANGGSLEQHRARHQVLQEAEATGNFVPVTASAADHADRPDPDPDLVGLPAGLRGQAGRVQASRS